MRLIDADALIDFIDCGHLRNPLESCFSEHDVVGMLEARPTIDSVGVVRCEDCKYFTDNGVCTFYSVFKNDGSYLLMQLMDDDDFCSCGERKESNEI